MTWATPTLAALVAAIFLTGCCTNRSLIKIDTPDELVERRVAKELEGKTDLEERFQTVARMVDWSVVHNLDSPVVNPIVYWDSDLRQMTIPIVSGCWLGNQFAHHEAVIEFDDEGNFTSVERAYAQFRHEFYPERYVPLVNEFEDPWKNDDILNGSTLFSRSTDHAMPAMIEITSEFSASNRVIEFGYFTTADSKDQLDRDFQIITDPPTQYILIDHYGPIIDQSPLGGAYIVQEMDFASRSGSWRPVHPIRKTSYLKFRYYYQGKILLEPHSGVTLTIGLEQSKEQS